MINRLAEHARLGFDSAHAPADDAQAIDHCRVAVGADEAIGHRHAIFHGHHLGEIFQIHLMHDARGRWNDAEIVERLLAPFQKFIALAVAFEFLSRTLLKQGELAAATHPPAPSDRSPDRPAPAG